MSSTPSRLLGAVAVALALWASGPARATTVSIDDTAANDTITVKVDNNVVVPDFSSAFNETISIGFFRSNGIKINNVHPPKTVAQTAYFREPGGPSNVGSDQILVQLMPNNDMVSSQLSFTFQSDLNGGNGILIPNGSQVFDEQNGAVNIGPMLNFGVAARDFPTQRNFNLTINSEPEPAALTLMAIGTVGMVAYIRRVRRRRPV